MNCTSCGKWTLEVYALVETDGNATLVCFECYREVERKKTPCRRQTTFPRERLCPDRTGRQEYQVRRIESIAAPSRGTRMNSNDQFGFALSVFSASSFWGRASFSRRDRD